MRFRSITLFLALGTAGTVACGDGGGPANTSGAPPLKNGPYQAPPSTYDAPSLPNPSDYDRPETDYESPPDQSEAGGTASGGSVAAMCTRLCHELLSLNCTGVPSGAVVEAECVDDCSQAEFEIPCPGPFVAALSCLFDNVNWSCALLSGEDELELEFEEVVTNSCRGPFEDYVRCAGDQEPQEPPPQQGDCEPETCRNCATDCDSCWCELNDPDTCNVICANT
jgi:hypothetical protein